MGLAARANNLSGTGIENQAGGASILLFQSIPRFSRNPYDNAALDLLLGKIPFLNGVLGDISKERTDQVRARIAQKRADFADEKPEWRRALEKWLKHAEYCCDEADRYREERPARNAEWENYQAEKNIEQRKARELLKNDPPKYFLKK